MTDRTNASTGTSAAGLRGVAAATSSISDVNGEKGELIYQGYNIHDLAKHSTFEEVVFLLWNKRPPNDLELSELKRSLSEASEIPKEIIELMKQFPDEADPTLQAGRLPADHRRQPEKQGPELPSPERQGVDDPRLADGRR